MIIGPCFFPGFWKARLPFFSNGTVVFQTAFARDVNGIQQTFGILEKCGTRSPTSNSEMVEIQIMGGCFRQLICLMVEGYISSFLGGGGRV